MCRGQRDAIANVRSGDTSIHWSTSPYSFVRAYGDGKKREESAASCALERDQRGVSAPNSAQQ